MSISEHKDQPSRENRPMLGGTQGSPSRENRDMSRRKIEISLSRENRDM